MRVTQAREVNESPKQSELDAIASTINFSKLPHKKSLSVDMNGVVDIDSSHPNYKHWLEDDK